MSVGDLLRYLFMAAVAFVLLFVGLKIWGKQKAAKRVVRELRVLANPTSSTSWEGGMAGVGAPLPPPFPHEGLALVQYL